MVWSHSLICSSKLKAKYMCLTSWWRAQLLQVLVTRAETTRADTFLAQPPTCRFQPPCDCPSLTAFPVDCKLQHQPGGQQPCRDCLAKPPPMTGLEQFPTTECKYIEIYKISYWFCFSGWTPTLHLGHTGIEVPLTCTCRPQLDFWVSSVKFSQSLSRVRLFSDSLRPHGPQHTRPPCPSPTPRVYSNSCPLSQWLHSTISSSVVPFSSCPQSFPASGSFPWVSSSNQVAKVLEFQLQHQSF